jgi:aquaporin Z
MELDIYLFELVSSLNNPARSLAPELISGLIGDLWLYWSATFIGTSIIAFLLRRKFPKEGYEKV